MMGLTLRPPRVWSSEPPDKCHIGGELIIDEFIDGKTKLGPWAIMCPMCHSIEGTGLGLGKGQRYELEGDVWVKTEG